MTATTRPSDKPRAYGATQRHLQERLRRAARRWWRRRRPPPARRRARYRPARWRGTARASAPGPAPPPRACRRRRRVAAAAPCGPPQSRSPTSRTRRWPRATRAPRRFRYRRPASPPIVVWPRPLHAKGGGAPPAAHGCGSCPYTRGNASHHRRRAGSERGPERPHAARPGRARTDARRPVYAHLRRPGRALTHRHARRVFSGPQRREGTPPRDRARAEPRDGADAHAAARLVEPALGAGWTAPRLPGQRPRRRRHHGERSRRQRRAARGAGRRHEPSLALSRTRGGVGARWPAHRVRVGHAWARKRRRQRRPDGDHAVSLQAHGWRGPDALQRQSAHASVRGRRRHAPGHAAHDRDVLRALDRLGAEGR